MARKPLRVVIVTSEAAPYATTGGLGDFASALATELERAGHDVMIVLPLYRIARRSGSVVDAGVEISVPLGGRVEHGRLWKGRVGANVPVYLLQCDKYYDRDGLYRTANRDYIDNAERFTFLSRGALEACRALGFRPEVVHANDWQTGLVPAYLRTVLVEDPFWADTGCLFTIHNLAYQGIFPQWDLRITGLPPETFSAAGVEFHGKISFIKAGIVFADVVNTTSRRYAREVQQPEFGCGLDGLLRNHAGKLEGVVSGMTYNSWDPASDPHIARNYDLHSLAGKEECKAALLAEMKLEEGDRVPLVGMISPLRADRGFDILCEAFGRMLRRRMTMVIMGRGQPRYREYIEEVASAEATRVAFIPDHDPTLAHRIIAGSDLFLIPSRSEPSGSNHAYCLRYGTIPVVHATGVLDDWVRNFDPRRGTGNGFKFREYSASHLLQALRKALDVYAKRRRWRQLMINAIKTEHTWKQACNGYVKLYVRAQSQRRRVDGGEGAAAPAGR